MACVTSLSLNPSLPDSPMDMAVDATTAIVGIRGNRLFVCDHTSGGLLSQLDVGQYARQNGCLSFDAASGRIYAAAWNTPQWSVDATFQSSTRNLYRLHLSGNTLVLDQTVDIGSTFSLASNRSAALDVGIMAMHPYSVNTGGINYIYCKWAARAQLGGGTGGSLRFNALNLATFNNGSEGFEGGYNNVVYGSIGGHDNAICPDPAGGPQVVMFDYTSSVENTFNNTLPKLTVAVGFAPVQQHVFVTDLAQKIYIYSTAGALLATADTLQSAFNGLAVRLGNDGKIYVAGGNSNMVAQIDPTNPAPTIANGGIVMISGFDCPVDIITTSTTRFAVQAGSTPLKAF